MNIVTTLDSCSILINKDHHLKFDEENFDEYHHFVEDYCMQIKYIKKLKIYTLLIDTYLPLDEPKYESDISEKNYFIHYGATFINEGTRWGNWIKYKKILDKKWGTKVITT